MTTQNAHAIAALPSTWEARLALGLARTPRGTRLVSKSHEGPLYVQKPFYPEGDDLAHIYILHPPGGLVSGDRLQIDIHAGASAHTLLTTPGAGRVYRARADGALQTQNIRIQVDAGASVEWLPLETIVFDGARTHLDTRVELAEGALYAGWEVTSLGLPACDSTFARGELQQTLQISVQGRLRLRERLRVQGSDAAMLQSRTGLQGMPINGMLVAGPFAAEDNLDDLVAALREAGDGGGFDDCLCGISRVHGFLVGRYLGHCSEQARTLFEGWWALLRPHLLRRRSCRPRIWLT